MADVSVFRNGVPTAPDVKKLLDTFPVHSMQEGQILSYDDVARIIGVHIRSSRFKTVTAAWRKTLEQTTKIVLKTLSGRGFMVATDRSKLDMAVSKYNTATKMMTKAVVITTKIDTAKLDSSERETMTKLQKNAGLIAVTNAAKRPAILPEL